MALLFTPEANRLDYLPQCSGVLHPPIVRDDILLNAGDSERKRGLHYSVGAGLVELHRKHDRPFGINVYKHGEPHSVLSERVGRIVLEQQERGWWLARDTLDRVRIELPEDFVDFVDLIACGVGAHHKVDFPELV